MRLARSGSVRGLGSRAVAGVQGLDRVGGANDSPDLDVVVQERDELTQALSHNRTIAGNHGPHFVVNSVNRSRAAASVAAGVDRFEVPAHLGPVLTSGIPEGVAQQVDDKWDCPGFG